MNISKKALCVLASILIGASVFFPFISESIFGISMSVSLMDGGDGIIVLIIAVIAILFSVLDKHIPTIILGALTFGLFFLENQYGLKDLGENGYARSLLQNDVGYYMLLIGSIMLLVFSIMGLAEKNSAKKE